MYLETDEQREGDGEQNEAKREAGQDPAAEANPRGTLLHRLFCNTYRRDRNVRYDIKYGF
jgi:hypothetical protein